MKKPTNPAPEASETSAALPQTGGSYIRLPDGTLQLEEATDSRPEAIATALEATVNSSLKEA